MPICTLTTNLKSDEIPDDIEMQLTNTMSEVLNKPKERITVLVNSDARMCKNGSKDVTCLLTISSINVFDEEKNPGYTDKLSEFLVSKLKIPRNRVVLVYKPLEPYMVG